MKVIHLSYANDAGGAARAATRIHKGLIRIGVESLMCVDQPDFVDSTTRILPGFFSGLAAKVKPKVSRRLIRLLTPNEEGAKRSIAIFGSRWVDFINASEADVVHLHWINNETLSISDIAKIRKPIVWTFHDLWPLCGAEHLPENDRWRWGVAYSKDSRPETSTYFDIDRWCYKRKRKYWHSKFQIVAPSEHVAECVKESSLMGDWPVSVIPNCLDLREWSPESKMVARQAVGVPNDVKIVAFGTYGNNKSLNKGFDLLQAALLALSEKSPEYFLITFGDDGDNAVAPLPFGSKCFGRVLSTEMLRLIYSCADVIVVPSRFEAFGQVASEANSCGTPVVAFNTSGLRSIVDHKSTGYLAIPFDPNDLATGIDWACQKEVNGRLALSARLKAEAKFCSSVVANSYYDVYEGVCR